MTDRFSRTAMLIGQDGLARLSRCKVAVFGLGGVGSYAVEGLARAGTGVFYLVDYDTVDLTNCNRQIHALTGTTGRFKTELMAERIVGINPGADVSILQERYKPGSGEKLVPPGLDYLVDAIDDIAAKVDLILYAINNGIPLISSMGAGNRLDPGKFEVSDISRTSTCPLARVVRRKLRDAGIDKGVKVVYSTEKPYKIQKAAGHGFIGSISFVPAAAGLIMAGEVVKDLLALKGD